jgi:hypothetical protein
MELDTYISWVKEVNIKLASYNKCLSCFEIKDSLMKQYFSDGLTPSIAAEKLYHQSNTRNYCMCIVRNVKKV